MLKNGKTYTLYSDGNLYEEIEGKGFIALDNLNEDNKKIISDIMELLKPAKTDRIDSGKNNENREIIEIDEL